MTSNPVDTAYDVGSVVSGVESIAEVATLLIARFWDVLITLYDPLLPTPSNYHIAPTEVAADKSFIPASLRLLYGPYQSPSAAVLPPVTS
ncbi:hypothetical protein TNCV_4521381 [Trichonephila clavipes]|nr:hypothetical protein TNCV_4521381 [Trichonephila clavipes]